MSELESVGGQHAITAGAESRSGLLRPVRLEPGQMTPELIRAARGYLDWSASELAERADVSFSTVRRAEATGERHLRDGSLAAIRHAFEQAGLFFIRDAEGNPGLIAR